MLNAFTPEIAYQVIAAMTILPILEYVKARPDIHAAPRQNVPTTSVNVTRLAILTQVNALLQMARFALITIRAVASAPGSREQMVIERALCALIDLWEVTIPMVRHILKIVPQVISATQVVVRPTELASLTALLALAAQPRPIIGATTTITI